MAGERYPAADHAPLGSKAGEPLEEEVLRTGICTEQWGL
jgi:hypothetical protein